MASVGATIANRGVWARPRVAGKVVRRRRGQRVGRRAVRDMMIGVVRGGTGTAAAIPGITVAGKTGTAELVAELPGPEEHRRLVRGVRPGETPKVAVAVMLVGRRLRRRVGRPDRPSGHGRGALG